MLKYNRDSNYLPYVPAYVIGLKQEGGEIEMSEENMTTEEPEQDPMEEIIMTAQKALETKNSELAMQVCQMLIEYIMEQQNQMQNEEQ